MLRDEDARNIPVIGELDVTIPAFVAITNLRGRKLSVGSIVRSTKVMYPYADGLIAAFQRQGTEVDCVQVGYSDIE